MYKVLFDNLPNLPGALCAQVGGTGWDILSELETPNTDTNYYRTRICGACPVQEACLETALDPRIENPARRSGIWGGKTPAERTRIFNARHPEGLCVSCLRRPTRGPSGIKLAECPQCRASSL